jgi:hypothetical protein
VPERVRRYVFESGCGTRCGERLFDINYRLAMEGDDMAEIGSMASGVPQKGY